MLQGAAAPAAAVVVVLAAVGSADAAAGPVLKQRPVVAGSPLQGGTVHVDTGRWRPKPSAFVFQWARCNAELRACKAISGETRDTHDIGAADLGHVLVAIVQARSGATSRAVFSTATGLAVAGGGAAKPTTGGPSITIAPAVAEVLQQGNQLTGSVGSWSGKGTITYTYSWYRCDAAGTAPGQRHPYDLDVQ